MTFYEHLPIFSVHGEQANPREVDRMASELMECRAALLVIGRGVQKYAQDTVWVDEWRGMGSGVHITAQDIIDELTKIE